MEQKNGLYINTNNLQKKEDESIEKRLSQMTFGHNSEVDAQTSASSVHTPHLGGISQSGYCDITESYVVMENGVFNDINMSKSSSSSSNNNNNNNTNNSSIFMINKENSNVIANTDAYTIFESYPIQQIQYAQNPQQIQVIVEENVQPIPPSINVIASKSQQTASNVATAAHLKTEQIGLSESVMVGEEIDDRFKKVTETGNLSNLSDQRSQQVLQKTQLLQESDMQKQDHDQWSKEAGTQSFEPDLITVANVRVNRKKQMHCIQLKSIQTPKLKLPPETIIECEGKDKVIVGRAKSSDIKVDDALHSISSKHACIFWKPQKEVWSVSDEGSTNGTYIIVNNTPMKEGDTFIIGFHLCTVISISKFVLPIEVALEFENITSDESKFKLTAEFQGPNQPFKIGKKYQQKQFADDKLMEDDHCYIVLENQKIKLKNSEGVNYRAAKKIESTKSVDLAEGSILRFGLVNQYSFMPYVKDIVDAESLSNDSKEINKCPNCKQPSSTLYKIEPCNHGPFCINCVSQDRCVTCRCIVKNFQ